MPFYIRKGNEVFREIDLITGPKWSEINGMTSRIQVSAFTTRRDAQDFAKESLSGEQVEICNNLDYKQ